MPTWAPNTPSRPTSLFLTRSCNPCHTPRPSSRPYQSSLSICQCKIHSLPPPEIFSLTPFTQENNPHHLFFFSNLFPSSRLSSLLSLPSLFALSFTSQPRVSHLPGIVPACSI